MDPWAAEFDGWVAEAVARRDFETLFQYGQRAPFAEHAAPTSEHFDPLFVVLGASPEGAVETVYGGFQYGHMSMRCFAIREE